MPAVLLQIITWLGRIGLGIFAIHEVTETGKETIVDVATSENVNTGALGIITLIPLLLVLGVGLLVYKTVK